MADKRYNRNYPGFLNKLILSDEATVFLDQRVSLITVCLGHVRTHVGSGNVITIIQEDGLEEYIVRLLKVTRYEPVELICKGPFKIYCYKISTRKHRGIKK